MWYFVKIIMLISLLMALVSCEERVSKEKYDDLFYEYRNLEDEYGQLSNDYSKIRQENSQLQEKYAANEASLLSAQERVRILSEEFNKMRRNHWALTLRNIEDDASDVMDAQNGKTYFYRERYKNGRRY